MHASHAPLRFAALTLSLASALPAAPPPATDLPVKEIALFSSGVGYFQHEGPVKDNARVELQFKTAQINDILKSLVPRDLGGGTVSTVTYPSQDPIEKTLRSFQVDITANPPLADLLNQLRGAKVTLTAGTEKMVGVIVGVETREVAGGGERATPLKTQFLNVLTGGAIRTVAVNDLRGLQFEDAGLQSELEKALSALAAARDKDKKTVALQFNGKGERAVRLGYVVETPVWKTSYRLVFGAGGADAKPQLQGWALVENQTENDWTEVKLSLVSGRPISFVQDLFSPLYVTRQVVENDKVASVRAQRYEEGRARAVGDVAKRRSGSAIDNDAEPARVIVTGSYIPTAESEGPLPVTTYPASRVSRIGASTPASALSSLGATAETQSVGELFQYTVGGVSLARQRSAMIPIVNDAIEAEKVSIYNESVEARFPLYGARLKNSVKLHLLGGPISVFDEGRYAGDARIGDVPPGQTRLLSYGVDLQLPVLLEDRKNDEKKRLTKIRAGILEVSERRTSSVVYSAENKSNRAKKLIIEHPRGSANSKLVDTPEPAERTASLYRFELTVEPGKVGRLAVRDEVVESEQFQILEHSNAELLELLQDGEPSPALREALNKVSGMQRAISETEERLTAREAEIKSITTEQNRLRENVKTAGDKSEYGVRLLRKLNEQETQIEKLQAEVATLQKKRDGQRKELSDHLKTLNLN
ncbi:MAG: DUF4139 domain-containing protein [Verrucomicrobia bacterium]|nr:DUF4139 domain-containing protein [Verrucomicrobiota bacterium]